MRARYPSLQSEVRQWVALKHVPKDACEQVHLEYSNTRLELLASNGRGENSVSAMQGMLRDQLHFSMVSWSVDVAITTNNHVFSKLGFLV